MAKYFDRSFWRGWFDVAKTTAGYSFDAEIQAIRLQFGPKVADEVTANRHLIPA